MKFKIAFWLSFISTIVYSQEKDVNRIIIDTIEYKCSIRDLINVVSFVPQLRRENNSIAILKINQDLKKYFNATLITIDSAAFLKNLFDICQVKTIEEYKHLLKDNPDIGIHDKSESFIIEYLSENLINISVSKAEMPYQGQLMWYYNSLCYDLATGEKLEFKDFFSISNQKLSELMKNEGYFIEEDYEAFDTLYFRKIEQPNDGVDIVINYIIPKDSIPEILCTDYYFNKVNNEIHLRFKYACSGPSPEYYGISLNKLSKYINYSDFKNILKLWGNDINLIIGTDYYKLRNKIDFDSFSIVDGGGYLLTNDKKYPDLTYGISVWNSKKSVFCLFIKYEKEYGLKKSTIIDILEIKKTDLKDNKIIGTYCETLSGEDPEVIALVKDVNHNPEFYDKILKAWKANRQIGKFETIENKKIKKCGNESYGN